MGAALGVFASSGKGPNGDDDGAGDGVFGDKKLLDGKASAVELKRAWL